MPPARTSIFSDTPSLWAGKQRIMHDTWKYHNLDYTKNLPKESTAFLKKLQQNTLEKTTNISSRWNFPKKNLKKRSKNPKSACHSRTIPVQNSKKSSVPNGTETVVSPVISLFFAASCAGKSLPPRPFGTFSPAQTARSPPAGSRPRRTSGRAVGRGPPADRRRWSRAPLCPRARRSGTRRRRGA